jgi:plasmid stabilization system protein ParE
MRRWRLQRFPHLVFYFPTEHEIRVYRVFHGAQDYDVPEPEEGSDA